METNEISREIIGSAIDVHKVLGPGMLESAYEECLSYELRKRGLEVARQVAVPLIYKEVHLDCGYRLDLLVQNQVIVELKSVDALIPVHEAQILTHMRLSGKHLGLLLKFNVKRLKDGLRRYIL